MTGDEKQPKYQRIADDLNTRIGRGEYVPGDRLPSKAELMKQYDVALSTVDAAVRHLQRQGIAETKHGVGTFVLAPKADEPTFGDAELAAAVEELQTRFQGMSEDQGRVEGNLVELYGLTGHEYPSEDLPDTEKSGRREQRA